MNSLLHLSHLCSSRDIFFLLTGPKYTSHSSRPLLGEMILSHIDKVRHIWRKDLCASDMLRNLASWSPMGLDGC